MFSQQAGKFVCATAGPNLGPNGSKRSGTVDKTGEGNGAPETGMNVDVAVASSWPLLIVGPSLIPQP